MNSGQLVGPQEMSLQRLRNFTTGVLHTTVEQRQEDFNFLLDVTRTFHYHMLPFVEQGLVEVLKTRYPDQPLWDQALDQTISGSLNVSAFNESEIDWVGSYIAQKVDDTRTLDMNSLDDDILLTIAGKYGNYFTVDTFDALLQVFNRHSKFDEIDEVEEIAELNDPETFIILSYLLKMVNERAPITPESYLNLLAITLNIKDVSDDTGPEFNFENVDVSEETAAVLKLLLTELQKTPVPTCPLNSFTDMALYSRADTIAFRRQQADMMRDFMGAGPDESVIAMGMGFTDADGNQVSIDIDPQTGGVLSERVDVQDASEDAVEVPSQSTQKH